MAKLFAQIRIIAGALALAFVVATAMPVAAQQPSSVNPTAAAVKEQQLLQQLNKIEGRGTIPDVKSYTLEQPAGHEWREFRTVTLKWIGGIAILGILALLDDLLFVARHHAHRGRTLGAQDSAVQRVRAFRALADRRRPSSSSASPASTSPSAAA